VPGIQRARAMRLHVVVSDANPSAPGFAAGRRSRPREHVRRGRHDCGGDEVPRDRTRDRRRDVHAADVPLTVASVAGRSALPASRSKAPPAADKLAMKLAFQRAGIPIPWFQRSRRSMSSHASSRTGGVPLVLKPVDRPRRARSPATDRTADLAWAFGHASSHSQAHRDDRGISGRAADQHGGLLIDGVGTTCGFIDRNYEHLDTFAPLHRGERRRASRRG